MGKITLDGHLTHALFNILPNEHMTSILAKKIEIALKGIEINKFSSVKLMSHAPYK